MPPYYQIFMTKKRADLPKKANNKFSSYQMRSSEYKDHNINKDACLDMEFLFFLKYCYHNLISFYLYSSRSMEYYNDIL